MKENNETSKELKRVLLHLMNSGIRPERMATELNVSYGTIKSWMTGRRHPKTPTIKQLEHVYGVKIL